MGQCHDRTGTSGCTAVLADPDSATWQVIRDAMTMGSDEAALREELELRAVDRGRVAWRGSQSWSASRGDGKGFSRPYA